MSTHRERLERKAERREEWAAKRRDRAEGLERQNLPLRKCHAFNTQPGYIPERARANRRSEKAWEHSKMAGHHESKAKGLRTQLDRSIYSDDLDAIEKLEARIAERDAERDRYKAYNASCRRAAKKGERGDLSLLDDEQKESLLSTLRHCSYQVGPGGAFPAYVLSNLGATIRTDKKRLDRLIELQKEAAS